MTIAQALLAEWRHEAAQTRKMLQAVPQDKLEWKPHAKSMTLGHLAMHIAWTNGVYGPGIIKQSHMQPGGHKQPEPKTTTEIVEEFDKTNAVVEDLLTHATDAQFMETWTFGPAEKPFMQLPRAAAVRGFLFSHLIHHRGQLSVYLRMVDAPVPGMYGPSADERM